MSDNATKRLTDDLLAADATYRALAKKSAASIAEGLVGLGWRPPVLTDNGLPLVTSWSARKAHIDAGTDTAVGNPMTRCGQYGTRAEDRTTKGPISQAAIDDLPLCGLCKRRLPKAAQ